MVKKAYVVAVASRLKTVSPDLYDGEYGDRYDPPAVKIINSVISQALNYDKKCMTKNVFFPKIVAKSNNLPCNTLSQARY